MRVYDKFVAETHPGKILFHKGMDFESRKMIGGVLEVVVNPKPKQTPDSPLN